jgi:hypothetical protein
MKTILVLLLMVIAQRSYSQSAIYWGENKVAGIAYRAESDRAYTMDELKKMALDECHRQQESEAVVKAKLFAAFRKDGGIKESEVLYNACA